MPVTHEINLNLSKYILPATVHMMQGDADSRTVIATIWDGPVKYIPAEGVKPMVRFGKPDGTGGLYNKTETDEKVILSGSKVTAPIARQVLTVPGIVKMQIELYEGDTKISAFPFQIHVIPSSKDDAEEISKDYADFSISYEVLGRYSSLSELTTAHPTGKAGDAWFVGTESDNVVYQWDVDQKSWVNVGSMKGPKGDPGEKGDKGAQGDNVTDEQVSSAVSTWLTAHPEATTTVQDGAVTDAKLSDDLYKQVTGNERHTLTEVSVPLIEYQYNSWVMAAGTNNGIAPIKTPKKFRITNPSATAEVGLLMRFLDGEDPETAAISDNQVAREGFYWRVPAGETVEFETLEYGRIATKYIQIRWNNWPRVLLDITAIYDSYVPPEPVLDTVSEYLQDFPMRWTLQPRNTAITHETAFCCVPFYPDTTYYVYNPDRIGLYADDVPDGYGLPDETFFTENHNGWSPTSGGLTKNIPVHVYKKVATSEKSSDRMIKITTKSWAETMGCKWLAIPCGGQQMRYPITAGSTLDQDTIKAWFDGIQAAGSPISYVSRFNKKIDRHIYSQIVMLNPALPNDEGTMGMAMALQMPSPLAKAKWMLFGDSLTDAYGGQDLTGKYFASKIAREFGMTLDNRAMDGSNIYRGGSGNYVSSSGMIKLDELVAEIDAGTTEQPDYITIAFGTNSFTAQIGTNADTSETDTSVYGATKRFIEVLREKCPKSVFGFVLSPKQQWPQSADPSGLRAIDAARAAIKAVCDDYGVPYIDMSTQSGITVSMLPDGLHISNDQSQNLYYHAMRRFMLGL